MGDRAKRGATYADLVALPPNVVGELIFGVVYAMPRPRIRAIAERAAAFRSTRIPVRKCGGRTK